MATATTCATRTAAPSGAGDRLYRLSLEQYQALAEAGILGEKERVVLLHGLLVGKRNKSNDGVAANWLGFEALRAIVPAGWRVGKENPLVLPDGPEGCPSVPEPDLMVHRGSIREIARRAPHPSDVALVVEVALSSLREDRAMLECYAWSGIPTAWIVNLKDRAVEAYTDPTGPDSAARYRRAETYGAADEIPVAIDAAEVGRVRVRDLLP